MKIQILVFLLAAAAAAMAILTQSAAAVRDQKLIETTCKNTPDYKLCITIIMADPSSPRKELPDLALVVVADIKNTTIHTLATIDALKKTSPPKLAPPLNKCKEVYTVVLEANIPVAEQATWGNPKFAENAMADTKIEVVNCEKAFKGVAPSPLSAENKYMADVASIARGIIRNLL